jgi:hypothetical protein
MTRARQGESREELSHRPEKRALSDSVLATPDFT